MSNRLIHKLLEAQADRTPRRSALKCGDQDLSYKELADRSARIARGLVNMGLKGGDRIAYLGRNDVRLWELLFAASAAGLVIVPLNWRLSHDELAEILVDCKPKIMVVEESFMPLASHAEITIGIEECSEADLVYDEWSRDCDGSEINSAVDPSTVLIQLYTSGTTGTAKGVELSHRSLQGLRDPALGPFPDWLIPKSDDVSLVALPMFHVAGIAATLDVLCTGGGGHVILLPQFDVAEYSRLLSQNAVTRLCMVPAMIRALIDNVPAEICKSPNLRHIIYGASPMTAALRAAALEHFDAELIQVYGLTETSGFIAALNGAGHRDKDSRISESIGLPLPGVELRVADEQGNEIADGKIGEILIRSVANMEGYYCKPEETTMALTADGWLRTGDAGVKGPQGHIVLRDRIKNMIISGGENIYPAEVENVISKCPGVTDVAVIGIPDEKWDERGCAIIVREDEKLMPHTIIEWARERIAAYKVPQEILFVEALPRSDTGKILHRVLRDKFAKKA